MNPPIRPLDLLEQTITQRAQTPGGKSYTRKLLAGGLDAIGGKIIEEAAELVEAAAETGEKARSHFLHEAADLVYHLLVLLQHKEVSLIDVEEELARRFGVSGIEEKKNRGA